MLCREDDAAADKLPSTLALPENDEAAVRVGTPDAVSTPDAEDVVTAEALTTLPLASAERDDDALPVADATTDRVGLREGVVTTLHEGAPVLDAGVESVPDDVDEELASALAVTDTETTLVILSEALAVLDARSVLVALPVPAPESVAHVDPEGLALVVVEIVRDAVTETHTEGEAVAEAHA